MRLVPWILVLLGSCSGLEDGVIVQSPQGKVRGYPKVSRSGRTYLAFMGIRYAKPPVGNLRFQPPEALPPWTGVHDVSEEGPECIQMTYDEKIIGTEDCLTLSVYTHNTSGNRPVLVHFPGGLMKTFAGGSAKWYSPIYLMDEDIVIANANYRVGIFGFLSFESPEFPGNQGMKDQVQILHWVRENIASFGGDPNQVTIVGESSGGASVYHHLVSPLSKGLYHRAISSSGSSYALWALGPPGFARSRAEKLMTLLGCPTKPEDAIPCALAKNATEIVSNLLKFKEWSTDPLLTFMPTLEENRPGAFLIQPISKWEHNPVPLLMGMCSAEGLIRTLQFLESGEQSINHLFENFTKVAPITLGYFASSSNPNKISERVKDFYNITKQGKDKSWENFRTMYSDSLFTNAVLDGANRHKGDVFFYYFDLVTFRKTPENPNVFEEVLVDLVAAVMRHIIFGTHHALDSTFIWQVALPNQSTAVQENPDIDLSKKLIKMWIAFAKTGKPDGSGVNWEKWTPENNFYVHIDNNGFHAKKGLIEDRYKFWNSLNYRDNYDKGYKPQTV